MISLFKRAWYFILSAYGIRTEGTGSVTIGYVRPETVQRLAENEDKAELYRQRRRDYAARMEGLNPDKQAAFEVKVRVWLDEDQPREDIERLLGHRLASVHIQMIKYGRGR